MILLERLAVTLRSVPGFESVNLRGGRELLSARPPGLLDDAIRRFQDKRFSKLVPDPGTRRMFFLRSEQQCCLH